MKSFNMFLYQYILSAIRFSNNNWIFVTSSNDVTSILLSNSISEGHLKSLSNKNYKFFELFLWKVLLCDTPFLWNLKHNYSSFSFLISLINFFGLKPLSIKSMMARYIFSNSLFLVSTKRLIKSSFSLIEAIKSLCNEKNAL